MRESNSLIRGISVAFVVGGCGVAGEPDGAVSCATQQATNSAAVRRAYTHRTGLHLNGLHLNGLHLNGLHLNGLHLNGLHLNGVTLNGSRAGVIAIDGAALSATFEHGDPVAGAKLIGAELPARLEDGSPISIRIDDVTQTDEPDILLYGLSSQPDAKTARVSLCGTNPDGTAVKAIPLRGTWDQSEGTPTGGAHSDGPGEFTFACEGYALAKCVDFGYAPWRTVTECNTPYDCHDLLLASFHQACTRMLRADYCGDGTATTYDGNSVDLWDAGGIQTDEAPQSPLEAEWGPGGATCVLVTRTPKPGEDQNLASAYIQNHCPNRWQVPGCGEPTSTFFSRNGFTLPPEARALLRTRVPPQ